MLVVIGIQVIQGESVVTVQEIHRAGIAHVNAVVQVHRTRDSPARLRCVPEISLQKITDTVTVFPIPLRPAVVRRERSNLIHAACIPGFCNQLDVSEDRIKGKLLQKWRILHRSTVCRSSENARKVKAEPIHMVIGHPVAKTFHNKALYNRVIAVHGIAAAGEVVVLRIRRQHVIDVIVNALKGNERAALSALCGMVEDHIQNHFDSVLLQKLDHLLQLPTLTVVLCRSGIAGVRGKKSHRVVAPVFVQPLPLIRMTVCDLVEFKDRQQLHCRDAQLLQIRNLLDDPRKGSGIRNAAGGILRKAANMELINYRILHLRIGKLRCVPDKIVLHHAGMVDAGFALILAPLPLSGHRSCIGIQKLLRLIEQKSLFRIPGAVNTIAVLEILHIQPEYNDRPHLANPIALRNRKNGKRRCRLSVI